jgi:hypothetical protein
MIAANRGGLRSLPAPRLGPGLWAREHSPDRARSAARASPTPDLTPARREAGDQIKVEAERATV